MQDWLVDHEPGVRFGAFLSVLIAMTVWEAVSPRREPGHNRRSRWSVNLLLAAINTGVVRLLLPLLAVGAAELASARHWGLLNAWTLSPWLVVPIAILVLDCLIYGQHVLFHHCPPLWRCHRVHHSDLEVDVTTGVRFHPFEIVISSFIKMLAILALGLPAEAVILFEVLLNGTSLFNHGNVRVPEGIDRALRRLVVTPDMHRVHHSVREAEANSNFGFNFSCWDRLFGTYRAQPAAAHSVMMLGLGQFRQAERLRLYHLLRMPFAEASRSRPDSGP